MQSATASLRPRPGSPRESPGTLLVDRRESKGGRGLVHAALDRTVRVAENATPRSIKKRQAILIAMIAKAIKGDVRAAALVVRHKIPLLKRAKAECRMRTC